jgi:hypothetical protein
MYSQEAELRLNSKINSLRKSSLLRKTLKREHRCPPHLTQKKMSLLRIAM